MRLKATSLWNNPCVFFGYPGPLAVVHPLSLLVSTVHRQVEEIVGPGEAQGIDGAKHLTWLNLDSIDAPGSFLLGVQLCLLLRHPAFVLCFGVGVRFGSGSALGCSGVGVLSFAGRTLGCYCVRVLCLFGFLRLASGFSVVFGASAHMCIHCPPSSLLRKGTLRTESDLGPSPQQVEKGCIAIW